MLFDLLLAALAVYFTVPLITGYSAYQYGRSFWLWFTLGTFLPILSFLILLLLIVIDEKFTSRDKLNLREKRESEELVTQLLREEKQVLHRNIVSE